MLNPDYSSFYLETVATLSRADIRPEFILIPERFLGCADRYYCFQAVHGFILSMEAVPDRGQTPE